MRLGISSYTYVWATGVPGFEQPRQSLTVEGLLNKAVALGVKVIQVADNLPLDQLPQAQLDNIAREAAEREILIEVGTCGFERRHLQTYFSLAKRLRSPLVRVVIDTATCHPAPGEVVATLKAVLPSFRDAGIWLAIENHDRFRSAALAEIIENAGGKGIGICLDTANSLGCGEDVFTVLCLAPWVVNVHLKDFTARRLVHNKGFIIEGCPAGQGVLDMPALLAELRRLPQDPNVILELWPSPEATLELSIAKEEAWARQSIGFLRQFINQ